MQAQRRKRVTQTTALSERKYDFHTRKKLENIELLLHSSDRVTDPVSLTVGRSPQRGTKRQNEDVSTSAVVALRRQRLTSDPSQRTENLRFSPYMFFHGEDGNYDEALKSVMRSRLAPLDTQEAQVSSDVTSPLKHNIFADLNQDDFSGGQVTSAIDKLYCRRTFEEELLQRSDEVGDEDNCSPNMIGLRKNLLRIVDHEHSKEIGHLTIASTQFKAMMRNTYDIEHSSTLEMLCREIDKGRDGHIAFKTLFDYIDDFVNGSNSKETAAACAKVFDTTGQRCLTLKGIKALRGLKDRDLPNGATPSMVKALLDMWVHTPGITGTVSWEQFHGLLIESEALVIGFLEEILRTILVEQFRHSREQLVEATRTGANSAKATGGKPNHFLTPLTK